MFSFWAHTVSLADKPDLYRFICYSNRDSIGCNAEIQLIFEKKTAGVRAEDMDKGGAGAGVGAENK